MAKYTSDASLIRGAGKAYRNLDNVGGMYAGLDKVIEVGTEMYETAVKKAEEEKAKKEAIEKSWNESADKVLLNAGALGDTIYNSTTEDVKKLKELYLEGVNEKDDTKRMSALRGLQSHSTWVQDHKQTNLDYAEAKKNGELSSYYKDSEKGRKEAHIIDHIMGQKYKKTSRAENDDVVFHIPAYESEDGSVKYEAMEVTSKQYNDMVLPKNYTIGDSLEKNLIEAKKSEIFDDNTVRQKIKKSLPNDERDFVAAMYDDVSGKNLIEMLGTSETLDQEIINAVDPSAWDTDPKGRPGFLDKSEKANFIDAVTNPDNEFFNLENSKQIMEDQLFNGIKNKHTNHWAKKNEQLKKLSGGKEGRDTIPVLYGGGYITTQSANTLLNDIKSKAKNIFPPNGGSYRFNEKTNTYEKLTKDTETGKITATPVSNQSILAGSGIWQQGYRIGEYGYVEPVVKKKKEENKEDILNVGLPPNIKGIYEIDQSIPEEMRIDSQVPKTPLT